MELTSFQDPCYSSYTAVTKSSILIVARVLNPPQLTFISYGNGKFMILSQNDLVHILSFCHERKRG